MKSRLLLVALLAVAAPALADRLPPPPHVPTVIVDPPWVFSPLPAPPPPWRPWWVRWFHFNRRLQEP